MRLEPSLPDPGVVGPQCTRHQVRTRAGDFESTAATSAPTPKSERRPRRTCRAQLSSLRRDYGPKRCPDHREDGFIRHVGWDVIASNLRHIGQHLAATAVQ